MARGRKGRYDERMDRKIFAKTWQSPSTILEVSVHAYAGKRPKLQISRKKIGRRRTSDYTSLGRLTRSELEGIFPLIQEAMNHM